MRDKGVKPWNQAFVAGVLKNRSVLDEVGVYHR
jgi:hypothetical protein